MPNKEFLEEYSLYRKFKVTDLPKTNDKLPKVRLNMACPTCQSDQTFAMTNEYWENHGYTNSPVLGQVFRAVYLCTHCQKLERIFYIAADGKGQWLMKIGQFPAWEILGNPLIEKMLGRHADHYKKGLVCESQSYGIGAYGYYRRIVEETIDEMLDEISLLLNGDDLNKFSQALAKTKKTTVTQEKIDLVKDLLPPILRPDGMNPLSVLHASLSEGLHAASDEACLEQAVIIREILVFLVTQVATSKAAAKSFTEGMRKLLEKKSGKLA
jgi:hypothetical protein